jgi:O-antigen ligase
MQFVILLIGLAALVWGGILLHRGGLLAGCLLILTAGSCFGHPFWNMPLGPAPITLDRLLLAAAIGQYVLLWKFGHTAPKPTGPTEWLLLAFIGVLVFSTFSHNWQVENKQPAALLIFFWLMPLALYWVARNMKLTEQGLWWIWGVMSAFGVYLAITAIGEVREMWWLVWPRYIRSPEFAEYFGRGRGPFLNPTGAGIYLTACLAATWMWWPRVGRWGKLGVVCLSLLLTAGCYFTLTRSVWMGVALTGMIVVGFNLPRVWRWPVVGMATLAGILVAVIFWDSLLSFKRDKNVSAQDVADSASLRPILAAVAWEMFCDRPILGCGFGQYKYQHKYYLGERKHGLNLEKARPYGQHNTFLALLTQTGLLGAGTFIALLIAWCLQAWQLWRNQHLAPAARQWGLYFLAFMASYVINGMFHDTSPIPNLNMLLLFFGAITSSLAAMATMPPSAPAIAPAETRSEEQPELAAAGA